MIVSNQFLCKQDIFENISARYEGRLVPTNQRVQKGDHSIRNNLCNAFIEDITTSNRTKISHERSIQLLWEIVAFNSLRSNPDSKKLWMAATTSSPTTDQADL